MGAIDIIDRICREKELKVRAFADKCGIPVQYLYDIRNGKISKLSAKRAQQINTVYPEYSVLWLLTGRGDVDGGKLQADSSDQPSGDKKRIAELEEELRKANERIDILLSMLAGNYKVEQAESHREAENEPKQVEKPVKRGRPRKATE